MFITLVRERERERERERGERERERERERAMLARYSAYINLDDSARCQVETNQT